jgi:hypothetical protein
MVDRETLNCLKIFDEFETKWTAYTKITIKVLEACCTKSVSTVYKNTWDTVCEVVLFLAEYTLFEI